MINSKINYSTRKLILNAPLTDFMVLEEGEIDEKEKRTGKKVMPSKDKGFVSKDGKKTYGDEQEELKKAFLEAVEREGLEDGEEDFMIPIYKLESNIIS